MITSQSEDTQRGSLTGSPIWLTLDPEPVYAVLHCPEDAQRSRTAVLMVPPFGWEGECSYRARRDWAVAFAGAGVTTVRFDLPGTEDSVGSSFGAPTMMENVEVGSGGRAGESTAAGGPSFIGGGGAAGAPTSNGNGSGGGGAKTEAVATNGAAPAGSKSAPGSLTDRVRQIAESGQELTLGPEEFGTLPNPPDPEPPADDHDPRPDRQPPESE